MELVSTTMVHMSVTALMDGKGNIVEMVIIITIKSLTQKNPVFRFWFSRISDASFFLSYSYEFRCK